ncbi:MAG: hypothetical protein MZW92_77280 [Comamonadaceae bacterium]|nr:hypothetical protein [Comamonadaceae bacterium]
MEQEIARFDGAIDAVRAELRALKESAAASAPSEVAALRRRACRCSSTTRCWPQVPREIIRERRCNAEWALVQQMEHAGRPVRRVRGRLPARAQAGRACRWSSGC